MGQTEALNYTTKLLSGGHLVLQLNLHFFWRQLLKKKLTKWPRVDWQKMPREYFSNAKQLYDTKNGRVTE